MNALLNADVIGRLAADWRRWCPRGARRISTDKMTRPISQ